MIEWVRSQTPQLHTNETTLNKYKESGTLSRSYVSYILTRLMGTCQLHFLFLSPLNSPQHDKIEYTHDHFQQQGIASSGRSHLYVGTLRQVDWHLLQDNTSYKSLIV